MSNKIIIGRLGAPYGIKGWLKLHSFTQNYFDILNYQPWFIKANGGWVLAAVEAVRPHGDKLVVKLMGCDNPEAAKAYTNLDIAIEKEQLPKLPADQYYWSDLEDLNVVTTEGVELGKVQHLIETGSNDVIIVQGDRRRLIPYIKEVIISVDLVNKKIVVAWDPDF